MRNLVSFADSIFGSGTGTIHKFEPINELLASKICYIMANFYTIMKCKKIKFYSFYNLHKT